MTKLAALMPLLAIALTTSSVFAAPPIVQCDAMYSEDEAGGGNMGNVEHAQATVTTKGEHTPVGKAILTTRLEQVCASDGGPCSDGYHLSTTLTIGDSSAYTSSDLDSNTPKYTRQHLSLDAAGKHVFVNCDVM
ncbi:MAG: hypothetical protein JST04_13255 [Bdellovibrionales bacterium]|nr:hypothetical protein [Bdellovibrionales bacterium]